MPALMEFLNATATESAAHTDTQQSFGVPCSKTELMAMLIHDVWFAPMDVERIDAALTSNFCNLSKRLGGPFGISNMDVIAICMANLSLGQVEGTLSEYAVQWYGAPPHWHFEPAVLVAVDTLYTRIQGGAANTAVCQNTVRIGYTLERVSERDFIAALVS